MVLTLPQCTTEIREIHEEFTQKRKGRSRPPNHSIFRSPAPPLALPFCASSSEAELVWRPYSGKRTARCASARCLSPSLASSSLPVTPSFTRTCAACLKAKGNARCSPPKSPMVMTPWNGSPVQTTSSSSYDYDPADPVPTLSARSRIAPTSCDSPAFR